MTVVVVRPNPEADNLVTQLHKCGISALAQPLLYCQPSSQISTLINDLSWLKNGDFVISVSAHAANIAHNYLQTQSMTWPAHLRYFAIGKKTATVLQSATQCQVTTPQIHSDSEHFLLLPEMQNLRGRRIVILRGNGGRELLYDTLCDRGAQVHYCEVYQRTWHSLDGAKLSQQWQLHHVSKIVITSGEQLIRLCQLIPKKDQNWLHTRQLFVPSSRIAHQAKQLGFIHIFTVGSAANAALLTTLSTMGPSDD